MEFLGKNAWFSTSVTDYSKDVWLKRKGEIVTDILKADFIFAKDPSAPDIAWFYKTKFFLEDGVMPFNSTWLKNPKKCLLDFILYPDDLKGKEFPKEWEFVDEEIDSPHTVVRSKKATHVEFLGFHSSMHDGFIHLEDLQIPKEIHIKDFRVNCADYQVFLLDAP